MKTSGKFPEVIFASDGGFSEKYGLAGDRGGIIRNKRYAAVIDSKTKDVVYLGWKLKKVYKVLELMLF